MRICYYPLCEATADVWYKGAWCAAHALKKWGAQVGTLSNVSPVSPPKGATNGAGEGSLPPKPSRPRGRASASGSLGVSESAPILSPEELFRILEVDGWSEFRELSLEEIDDRLILHETAEQMEGT